MRHWGNLSHNRRKFVRVVELQIFIFVGVIFFKISSNFSRDFTFENQDVRENKMVKKLEFYDPPDLPVEEFYQNQESAYPLSCVGFTNVTQDQLTVFG